MGSFLLNNPGQKKKGLTFRPVCLSECVSVKLSVFCVCVPVSIQTLTSNITINKDMFSTFSLFSFYSILKTLFRHKMHVKICARETRERCPLLTVEIEVNGIQRVQMKGALPWLVSWACRAGTRDFCSTLAALVGPVQNIFFLTVHFFNSFVTIAQQAGHGQAAVLGRLSLHKCLWSYAELGQMNCNTCS